MEIIVSGGRRRGGRHGGKKRRWTARRERKTGVERKNERERPVMAAMMTVSGCVYRLSRSVPARRPSRVNLNRSVSTRYSILARRARSNFRSLLFARIRRIRRLSPARASFPGRANLSFRTDRQIQRQPRNRKWNWSLICLFIYLMSALSNLKKRQLWRELSEIKRRTMVSWWSDIGCSRAVVEEFSVTAEFFSNDQIVRF